MNIGKVLLLSLWSSSFVIPACTQVGSKVAHFALQDYRLIHIESSNRWYYYGGGCQWIGDSNKRYNKKEERKERGI